MDAVKADEEKPQKAIEEWRKAGGDKVIEKFTETYN
ncbi:hypothetical protein Clst_0212 [Thermoclostridium stercorarium subsp. stercorarium DSM 8532]|jgi:hypothetical protein|nr:hypothetical protein Clst_0212 [Thermoclostridium stercorarium subsp. stercorarium DSM 8532]